MPRNCKECKYRLECLERNYPQLEKEVNKLLKPSFKEEYTCEDIAAYDNMLGVT